MKGEKYIKTIFVSRKRCVEQNDAARSSAETVKHVGVTSVAKDKCLKKPSRQTRSDTGATVRFFILHFLHREI